MKSRKLVRLGAVATLVAAGAVGVVATASPAGAIGGGCSGGYRLVDGYGVGTSSAGSVVWVDNYLQCNNAPISIDQPDSISKYVVGVGWQVVVSGLGYHQYSCTGGRYLYTTSVGGPIYCPT